VHSYLQRKVLNQIARGLIIVSAGVSSPILETTIIGVDDSEITLENKFHTILGGVILESADKLEKQISIIKDKHGVPDQELKWSGFSQLTPEQKKALGQDILPLLNTLTGFIVIVEGRDKALAAKKVCEQITDLLKIQKHTRIHFDQQIIDEKRLCEMLKLSVKNEDIKVIDSKNSIAVQCADFFIGYQKIRIENDLGLRSVPPVNMEDGEMDFGFYMFAQTCYSLWGEVPGEFSNEEAMDKYEYPIKETRDKGLRIFSSIPKELQDRIYEKCGSFWIGCIH
jgi:Protein of unknown function (DUF3800)